MAASWICTVCIQAESTSDLTLAVNFLILTWRFLKPASMLGRQRTPKRFPTLYLSLKAIRDI